MSSVDSVSDRSALEASPLEIEREASSSVLRASSSILELSSERANSSELSLEAVSSLSSLSLSEASRLEISSKRESSFPEVAEGPLAAVSVDHADQEHAKQKTEQKNQEQEPREAPPVDREDRPRVGTFFHVSGPMSIYGSSYGPPEGIVKRYFTV